MAVLATARRRGITTRRLTRTAGSVPGRYPSRHASFGAVLHEPARRSRRRGDAVAPTPRPRRLRPAARFGAVFPAAARLPRQQAGRAGHPRGDRPDRRAGDGDAGRPPGRRVAAQRSLRVSGARNGPLQGPRRTRHGHRHDPRGSGRRAARRHRPLVPPAAGHPLPLPDQVPRRAALARRVDPRPRVRDEGLVQLRPRRGRARPELLAPPRGLHAHLRAARAQGDPRQLGRRDDGRVARPRVHGPQPGRRGRPRPVRNVRLRGKSPGRDRAQAGARGGGPGPARGGRHTGHDDDRNARRVPRDRRGAHRQGGVLRHRRRPARHRDRARRLRSQRDEAGQRGQGDRWHAPGDGRGDPRGRHGAGLRLTDRCEGDRRRRRRPRGALAEPGRRGQPRGVPLPERERGPGLRAGHHRRHRERPRGRSLPEWRRAS